MRPPINETFTISQLFGDNPGTESYTSSYPWNYGARILRHDGIDLAVPVGTLLYPVWPGTVTVTKEQAGFGLHALITDENGRMFLYAHLSKVYVNTNDRVDTHSPFAESGGAVGNTNSGNSTGPHLHAGLYLPPIDKLNGFGGASDWLSSLDHDAVYRLTP